MARLYVVGTPIGNLGELSPRALEALRDCDLLLAEDTRVTRKLLTALDLHGKRLLSCFQHNEAGRAEEIVARMSQEDLTVCLVTDAGTPCISDPGYRVVEAAWEAGIPVQPISGPSAVVDAVSVSGFAAESYAFFGFLPRQGREREEAFARLSACPTALAVLYESPHRVKRLVADLRDALRDPRLSLSCDLTKLHELTLRGRASDILAALEANPNAEKGEYVCVVELPPPEEAEEETAPAVSTRALLLDRLCAGATMKDAVREVSALPGQSRNAVYRASLEVADFLRQAAEEES
ncbi:MAG: 16S rRNA (cytidine(1402)-2'-O)-methyltransferase [Candidatus Spyradocola sp.]|jgi:16S rRNA (cytidine1402-2'-O)-methyltransferase